ncbi:MAG: rhamnogalacturonan acetylesterase [Opitutaceae bacterium]|nr:rhamnogalacturonan acetylesterase [Opitutaceae bacterium]
MCTMFRLPHALAAGVLACAAVTICAASSEEQRPVEPVGPTPPPAINPALPTIWIAGDSTAANGNPNAIGWGRPFPEFFDASKVNVANRARGGRSARKFITEGLWDQMLADMKKGDIVLIQFGHNDGGPVNDDKRARGSLPGLGEETQEIDNLITKKHEVVHTYGWYMRKMIVDARTKGAQPVVLSLTLRNIWKDGQVERGSGRYGEWARATAEWEGVPFIDLSALIADEYMRLGEESVKALFPKDHTHTGPAGAALNARLVLAGLRALPRDPVAGYLTPAAAETPAAAASAIVASPAPPRGGGPEAFDAWLNLPSRPDDARPALFLVGDSTVRNGRGDGAGGQWGWGDFFAPHVDTTRLHVVNRAVGGLSSRTYYTQRWPAVRELLRPGDVVVVQLGTNDNGPINDDSRARGTLKGNGEETEAIDNLVTKQHEVVHTYGWYLRQFVVEARAKGASVVLCSPIPRKAWADGRIERKADSHPAWARAAAAQVDAPFIDLHERTAARFDALGEAAVDPLYADPHTHPSRSGATLLAAVVAEGLRELGAKNPLAAYMTD